MPGSVVITGGGSGVGKATAQAFMARGLHVVAPALHPGGTS